MKCFLSEKGHNNFMYPTKTAALISPECDYERLSWISGQSNRQLVPIKVLKSCILPLNFDSIGAKNLAPPEKDSYIVVWIVK